MHIVLGLIIALVIVAIFARRNRTTRNCRWRADKTGDKGNLSKYRCVTCGATGFSATGGPPRDCKSTLPKV